MESQSAMSIKTSATSETMGDTLADCLPAVYHQVVGQGAQPVGMPFTRYLSFGSDTFEIEAGMPVAGELKGEGRIQSSQLPAGTVVTTLYQGPYEGLAAVYRAFES